MCQDHITINYTSKAAPSAESTNNLESILLDRIRINLLNYTADILLISTNRTNSSNNYSEFPELLVLWPVGKPTGGDHCNGGLLATAHFSSHYIPLLYARRKLSHLKFDQLKPHS